MGEELQQKVGLGRTAEAFTYGEGKIIKLFYEWMPENVVQHEFNISSFIYSAGVPTAKPYEIVNSSGRLGIVYEQILPGLTISKMITAKPLRLKKYAKMLAQLHYALHTTTLLEIPVYIKGIKQGLVANISGTDWLQEAEKESILRHLATLPEEAKLCHLDFHPENVLMGEDPYIIDWTTCCIGSPLADVARTIIMLKYGSSPSEVPKWVSMLSGFAGNKIQQVYMKEYMSLSGCSLMDIERWIVPVAAGRLVEGIPDSEKEVLVLLIKKGLGQ